MVAPPCDALYPDFFPGPRNAQNWSPPPEKAAKWCFRGGPAGAGVGPCALGCATRPVGTVVAIGRRWLRCSTWTIGIRLLFRFGPSAPCTPSASRPRDVPHGRARRQFSVVFAVAGRENCIFWGCDRAKVGGFVIANFAPELESCPEKKFSAHPLRSNCPRTPQLNILVIYVHGRTPL